MYCNNCGKQLPDGSIGCPSCGTRFDLKDEKKLFCSKCGKQLASTAMQCPDCGAPTENAKKTAAPVVRNIVYASPSAHKGNPIAIIGFVLSLVDIPFLLIPIVAFITAVGGFVCSIIGLRLAGDRDGKGKGLSIAGIVLSSITLFAWVIIIFTLGCAAMLLSNVKL